MMKLFALGLIGISVMAAGTDSVQRAPNAPVADAASGEFVWHDLVTDAPAEARAFYGALFGWTFAAGEGVDPGYTIIKNGDRPIGGMVVRRADHQRGGGQWLSYMRVTDIDRATAAFERTGGRIIRGPVSARKDLKVAAVADEQGAVLGLASRGPRFGTRTTSTLHDWLWMEYVAQDPDRALDFYTDLAGYRYEISDRLEQSVYFVFSTDRPHAGLLRSLWAGEPSAWVPYIRVDDPAAMAARVTQLGGTVVIAPNARVRNGSLALVLDPAGAVIALQKYPFDKGPTR